MYPADLPPADIAAQDLPAEVRLVRVDVPDLPGALATSRHGSVLAAPPDDPRLRWRPEPVPEIDSVVADGAIAALDATPWHDAGYRGQGVHVAVFDLQWQDLDLYTEELGEFTTHDCFAHRSCGPEINSINPASRSEFGSHGVACAEVIHDIAPDARLSLVRVSGLTSLENAVDWAIRNEVDVISMSLSYFNESFYEGLGPVNAVMDELSAAGVLMVTSAGNYATEHHWDHFEDRDRDGVHDFPGQGGQALPIEWGAGTQRINLIWDDFGNCGDTDLDLYVYNEAGDLVGRSREVQVPGGGEDGQDCQPVERATVNAAEAGWYYAVVHHAGGVPATRFDIMARSGNVWQGRPEGSITDPGNHPSVFTVGAVRADGYLRNGAEEFSSEGPTHAGLPKPDIAGPDGLSTAIYGPRGFFGTSAATPAVAAAIALLMSEDPRLTARDAADRLRGGAVAGGATWAAADGELGAGRAVLPGPGTSGVGCGWSQVLPMGLLMPLSLGWRRRTRAASKAKG